MKKLVPIAAKNTPADAMKIARYPFSPPKREMSHPEVQGTTMPISEPIVPAQPLNLSRLSGSVASK